MSCGRSCVIPCGAPSSLFVLNTAAYTTEIFRGAIEAIPYGEVEAAKAYGMSGWKRATRIVLPSALRRALPAYSNEVIFMLHGSVVASTVTIVDILGAGRILNAKYYVAYEGFLTAAVLYMLLVYLITRGVQGLGATLARPPSPPRGVTPRAGCGWGARALADIHGADCLFTASCTSWTSSSAKRKMMHPWTSTFIENSSSSSPPQKQDR